MPVLAEQPLQKSKLMEVVYSDSDNDIHLKNYADTIIYDEKDGKKLLAGIRFGGYPEQVRAMADAIYGGGYIYANPDEKEVTIQTAVKQYRREVTHDGVYAEATLLIQDDRINADNPDEAEPTEKQVKNPPRTNYIFCEQGNRDQLYEELDKKVSVPLIPEFRDYVLDTLQDKKALKKLTVISYREKFDAWKLAIELDEKNIISVINDGLQSGQITIPGSNMTENPFKEIKSVSQYLNAYGVTIAAKIQNQFNPIFNPAAETLSPELLAVNSFIRKHAGYNLYDAQLAVSEALKRVLDKNKIGLCIAECGSGKTKIGAAALCAHQLGKDKKKHFNAVLCPSHLTNKWVRELEESLPNTFAVTVKSISDLERVYSIYEKGTKSCYIVMSKEKARDGYMTRPAVTWSNSRRGFLCPHCREKLMMEIMDCGSKARIPADALYFQKPNKKNRKCEHCKSVLWTVLVPNQQSEWVKISDYGFVHREFTTLCLRANNLRSPKIIEAIQEVAMNPKGVFPTTGAYNRFPLSTYINRKMRGKLDGVLLDELHQYNNDSGQGEAMAELIGAAKKAIGMTATLINGYSSGIFYLLYRVAPALMKMDDKDHDKIQDFNTEYGVTECSYEIENQSYNANRRSLRKKMRTKQLPGVSPLVYTRFLMQSAVFLSLNDMGKQLPEYEEIPIILELKDEVRTEYRRLEETFKDVLINQKDIAQKVMSAFVGLLTVYPDQPYDMKPIFHPIDKYPLVEPEDTSSFNELSQKDEETLKIVKRKASNGERCIVYTSWIRIDSQQKLIKLFAENGIRAAALTTAIAPQKREEWVEKQVASGIQVLITNPSLVETGLDLNDFTTLIYYNIGYNLFTLRQASRRSWRINQRAPRVEVYFFAFKNVMQHRAIRLMASKLAVAGIIEGNFSDEGLAAMSECQDMTTLLAQELTMGIRDEVEDLGAIFKQMAILKPQDAEPETSKFVTETAEEPENGLFEGLVIGTIQEPEITAVQNPVFTTIHTQPNQSESFQTDIFDTSEDHLFTLLAKSQTLQKTIKSKKKVVIDENQLSLFDCFEVSA